jgi:hypothetical protein
MPQAQEEDTTKCSQHGNNCIQLLLVIDVEMTFKSSDQLNGMDFNFSYEMANQRIYNLKG